MVVLLVLYMLGIDNARASGNSARFSSILESLPSRCLPDQAADNLPFGQGFNTPQKLGDGKSMPDWAADLPGLEVAATLEIPYADVTGIAVTPDSARAFGRNLARAIQRYLRK